MSFIVSKISFICKLDQALEKQVGLSEAFAKRTFAVILLIDVNENLLCMESLFREANYNCILFPLIKCFKILMKVPYLCGTFIHLISKIYMMNFMQCLEIKT